MMTPRFACLTDETLIDPLTSRRPRRRFRHVASTRAYRWMIRNRLVRRIPGEHFNVHSHVIRLRRMAAGLDGLRIAHLTDLHVGNILTPDRLGRIVDAVHRTEPDMIAVTGDMLDDSTEHVEPAAEAMAELDAPLGAYFVLGNHDYRDSVDRLIGAFNRRGLPLLINQSVQLNHAGCRITVGGIDFAHRDDQLYAHVRATARHMPDGDLRVLLAHHPHAFDAACRCGIDLTLSGHTHGGQMLLRRQKGRRESFGLGNLAWRYAQGQYRRDHHRLFVSNGVGSAFPVRLRCPAEISVLDLHAA